MNAHSKGAVLAIDHGTKRTGFAVVDALRIAPQPIDTFHGPGDGHELIQFIAGLLAERDIATILVGFPLRADGAKTARAEDVERFIERLRQTTDIEIVRHDEHLSTKEAEARLADAGYFGAERKARRDSFSAWVILQDWLELGEPRN